jgi:drug/metabolite transporter (DMT)-like permease
MNYITYIIIAAIFFAVYTLLTKIIYKIENPSPLYFTAITKIIIAISVLPLIFFIQYTLSPGTIKDIIYASIIDTLGYLLFAWAIARSDVSTVGPLVGMKIILAAGTEKIFLGQGYNTAVYIGVILSTLSIFLISYKEGKFKKFDTIVIIFMLIACSLWAATDALIKKIALDTSVITATFFLFFVSGILATPLLFFIKKEKKCFNRRFITLSSYASIALTISAIFLIKSFALTNSITIPNVLVSIRGIIIIAGTAFLAKRGIIRLEETSRKEYLLRSLGAALMSISIFLVMW